MKLVVSNSGDVIQFQNWPLLGNLLTRKARTKRAFVILRLHILYGKENYLKASVGFLFLSGTFFQFRLLTSNENLFTSNENLCYFSS